MCRKGTWADFLLGNACKCRLKSGDKFCFQLALDLFSVVLLFKVSAYIGIEKKRVCNTVGINTAAAHGHVNIQSDVMVYYTERNRIRCSELVVYQLFGVEIVNSLILAGVTAVSKTFTDGVEGVHNCIPKITGKDAGLSRSIVGIFAWFCADIYNLALLYDHHTLSVCNSNSRSAGDDVVVPFGIRGTLGGTFLAFHCQNVIVD